MILTYYQADFYLAICQVMTFMVGLVIDYSKEKEDRILFQKLYDYRESFTKFKNLIMSGLSSSVLILTKNLQQELFKNDCLMSTSGIDPSLKDKELTENLHSWLNSLVIDKESLGESTNALILSLEDHPSTLDFLKKIQSIVDIPKSGMTQDKFSFVAKGLTTTSTISGSYYEVFEMNILPLIWDEKDAIALIINNITENYQNARLKVADTNKDKMLAMISHELRTPLNGILGVVSILEKEIKDPQQLRYLTVCKNSGGLLLNLVNSILDLQQIRDKKFTLNFTRDDLHELLRGIYDLFKFQFDQKSLYLRLDIAYDVPEQVITDQNRLRQILINLIGNALKFTTEGGVHINVMQDEMREGYIYFEVADTGSGISEEDMKKLFKMYGRLDQPDLKTNTQGVGFGLEISNQLARLLADDLEDAGIKVESTVGEGTVFSFSIKDISITKQNTETKEIHYYEPRVFAEGVEDISLKISPYNSMEMFRNGSPVVTPKIPDFPMSNSELGSERSLIKPISFAASPRKAPTQTLIQHHSNRLISRSKTFGSPKNLSLSQKLQKDYFSPTNDNARRKDSFHDFSQFSQFSPLHPSKKIKSLSQIKGNYWILIVDDNPFNLLIAKHLVEDMGYKVNTVLSGIKALEEVKSAQQKSQQYCIILMDLQMPGMDGYETTRELRKMMGNKEIPEIPIIAVSANDTDDDKRKCKEVGMYEHLPKPLYELSLRKMLNKALGHTNSDDSFAEIEV